MQDVCYQSYHFHVLSFNNTLRLLVIPLNDGELDNSIRSGTTRRERKSNIPMNFNCNGETLAISLLAANCQVPLHLLQWVLQLDS